MFQAVSSEQLITDRLVLRMPTLADAPIITEAIQETLTELKPWMPWAQNGYSQSDAESYIGMEQTNFEANERLSFILFRKTDNLFVGSIGLHDILWQVPRFEIGYWLRTSATGHGYMTEAVLHLTRLCRTQYQARRMTIRCDSANIRSRQVAERAGYQLESLTKNDRRSPTDNSLRDMLTFVQIWPD